MSAFNDHFRRVSNFLKEYRLLVDSHLVDFVTEDLWHKCLPESLRNELESLAADHVKKYHWTGSDPGTPELNKFLKEIDSLALDKCNFVYEANNLPKLFSTWGCKIENLDSPSTKTRLEFMNDKKSHEVKIIAKVVASLAQFHSSIVVDAGAGKGYLSEYISDEYGIPVLGIDSSDVNHRGAIRRQNIIRKKSRQRPTLVRHLVQRIDDSTDFSTLTKTHFPTQSLNGHLTITGLHTCGSLGHSVIKAFLQTDCIKSLCLVTCCYHLADTTLSGRLNFSKNAKMLAQQSVERTRENEDCLSVTLHYRAILQILLHSMGMYDVKVGRRAPSESFATYARWALDKIGMSTNQMPLEIVLEELYNTHESYKFKMELFQSLRIRLGSVVESAILLDRIIYLEASKVCSNLALVRLFDPVISPRCYAIIATK